MKKFLFCLIITMAMLPSVFARTEIVEIDDYSGKVFGMSPGMRISILGLEPTFAVNYRNIEAEVGCSISTGVDGSKLGVAPAFSIGYCTNPFLRGACTTFGLEYFLLSSSYIGLLDQLSEEPVEGAPSSIQAISLFYKGGYHFNRTFGVLWRARLPLLMGFDGYYYNITNTRGALLCCLAGACTISAGVNFMF